MKTVRKKYNDKILSYSICFYIQLFFRLNTIFGIEKWNKKVIEYIFLLEVPGQL